MKKNKIILSVTVLVLLIAGIWSLRSFTSKEATEKSEPTLRYIVNNLGSIGAIDIAMEKGFFAEQGVKVEIVGVANGGAQSIQSILTENADIGGAAMPAYVNAVKSGGAIKVIYGGPASAWAKDPGTYWIVLNDSNIKTPKDLIGKSIAMGARGAIWEYGTKEYLRKAGLTIEQTQIVLVPPPQHEQVLRTKQVDVVVLSSPFADHILEGGGTRLLTSLNEILGEKLAGAGSGVIVRENMIQKYPELVKKTVAAMIKANQWMEEHPEDAKKVAADILKKRDQSPEVAQYWKIPHLRNYGLVNDEDVQFWIDWFVEEGKLKPGEIKPSDIYTNEFNPYYKK